MEGAWMLSRLLPCVSPACTCCGWWSQRCCALSGADMQRGSARTCTATLPPGGALRKPSAHCAASRCCHQAGAGAGRTRRSPALSSSRRRPPAPPLSCRSHLPDSQDGGWPQPGPQGPPLSGLGVRPRAQSKPGKRSTLGATSFCPRIPSPWPLGC